MSNIYLKATDESSLWEALESINLATKDYDMEDENNIRPDDLELDAEWEMTGAYDWRFTGTAIDMIGTIYTETGNMLTDDEGMEYPEMTALDGYHANLIANLTDDELSALPTVDAPATPYRKWAGE